MSELLKKYESIDQSKLNEATVKILNRVKTLTADFTADDEKNNKIAEQVLNEVMKKNPSAIKIVKRQTKAKATAKKTHKAKGTHTPTAKSSENNIMALAKSIRKAGESFKDAMERAKQELKERKEKAVQKQKTELEKLYELVKTKKELQGFGKSDIRRDMVREAKPRGARVVTKEGSTSNQYGTFSNKLGRKYWETRDRHADRLAPNYPKDMPLLAGGGAVSDSPFSVEVFKTKLRFDNELVSSSKGDFPTFAKAKEFAIDMIDSGNYYAYINSKNGYLWGVDSKGVEQFADGGMFNTNVHSGTAFMDNTFFKKGGALTEEEKMVKELHKLQRELNSSRLQTYRLGDTSEEEMARRRERESKLARFNDILKTLREKDVKLANGGGLPFMTDPNFGNFQNTGMFEGGGSMADLTEQEFLKKYFGVNVFTENPSQYFEIKKMSSSNDDKVDAFVKELKADGFTVKKRAYSDFTSVMGVKKKTSFELGGAFMTNDLAGNTGGGNGGLNADMPLDGFTGTNYTGLVGETGAMSSGELFMDGGAMAQNQQVINDASQPYVITEAFGNPAQHLADGGKIKDQYEGRTPEDIWNNLSKEQRSHFLYDHVSEIEEYKNIEKLSGSEIIKAYNSDWASLDKDIKNRFSNHVREGQYAYGGRTKSTPSMRKLYVEQIAFATNTRAEGVDAFAKDHNLTDSELSNLMTGIGRKMISQSDFITALVGNKNNPKQKEVIAFAKSDKAYKMADGGMFNTNVHSGTAFMDNAYFADGGIINLNDELTKSSSTKIEYFAGYFLTNEQEYSDKISQLENLMEKIKLYSDVVYTKGKVGLGFNFKGTKQELRDKLTEVSKEMKKMGVVGDLYPINKTPKSVYDRILSYGFNRFADGGMFNTNVHSGTAFMDNAYFAKGGFAGNVEFNVGDVVWQKDEKRYATVMNNYGDPINGDYGDVRLDTTGNTSIYTFDRNRKTPATVNTATGYNLIKLGEKGDSGKFTPDVLAEMKESANRLINSRKQSKDKEGVAYYEEVYKRLLGGEFDSMAKGTSKPTKYIDHDDINYVTLIIKGKNSIVTAGDILNGANLMEDGGDLSKIAFYVPKRNVVSVKLKNGEVVKPVNGYWVKKDYEPVIPATTISKNSEADKILPPSGYTFVLSGSHRATDKIHRLGVEYVSLYAFGGSKGTAGNAILFMSEKDFDKIKGITGVSKKTYLSSKTQWFSRKENEKLSSVFKTIKQSDSFADGGGVDTESIEEEIRSLNSRIKSLSEINTKQASEEVKELVNRRGALQARLLHIQDSYADGGMFNTNVHSGTAFMDNAYFAGGGSITPALNKKVVERAEKIYSEMNGKTKADFDKAYDKAIVEFGYSPEKFKAVMEEIGADDYDYFADGGMTNLTMQEVSFANGGGVGSGFDPVKVKVVLAVGIDSAIEFYDAEYPIRPYQLLEKAVRRGYITLDEINERVVDSAMEVAQDSEDMDEVGSSDETYAMQEFLDEAGFKVGFVNGRLTREFADGGFMEAKNGNNYRYPVRPINVETTDEPIDLKDNVSYYSSEVVVQPINESMDLTGGGLRARMGYNPKDRSPEKLLSVNPRAFEYMDLPMPTSHTHKND